MADFEWGELAPAELAELDAIALEFHTRRGLPVKLDVSEYKLLAKALADYARLRAEVERLREDAQRWRDSRLDE